MFEEYANFHGDAAQQENLMRMKMLIVKFVSKVYCFVSALSLSVLPSP